MGFGGSVSAMISSLKNNKRNRKTAFEKLEKYQKETNDKLHFDKVATKKELEKIRLRITKENRKSLIRSYLLILILTLALVYVIGFVNF